MSYNKQTGKAEIQKAYWMAEVGSVLLITWSTSEGSPYACWSSSAAEEGRTRGPRLWGGSQGHRCRRGQSYRSHAQQSKSSDSIPLHLHSFPSISPTVAQASDHTPCHTTVTFFFNITSYIFYFYFYNKICNCLCF